MATAKPKTKRMMLGGMAAGVASKALNATKNTVAAKAAPMKTQSGMQAAARSAATQAASKSVPAYAQPYVNKMQSRGALGGNKPPAGANLMQAYNAQKSGATKAAPQQMQFMSNALRSGAMKPPSGMMKKGGVVKKKATKK